MFFMIWASNFKMWCIIDILILRGHGVFSHFHEKKTTCWHNQETDGDKDLVFNMPIIMLYLHIIISFMRPLYEGVLLCLCKSIKKSFNIFLKYNLGLSYPSYVSLYLGWNVYANLLHMKKCFDNPVARIDVSNEIFTIDSFNKETKKWLGNWSIHIFHTLLWSLIQRQWHSKTLWRMMLSRRMDFVTWPHIY